MTTPLGQLRVDDGRWLRRAATVRARADRVRAGGFFGAWAAMAKPAAPNAENWRNCRRSRRSMAVARPSREAVGGRSGSRRPVGGAARNPVYLGTRIGAFCAASSERAVRHPLPFRRDLGPFDSRPAAPAAVPFGPRGLGGGGELGAIGPDDPRGRRFGRMGRGACVTSPRGRSTTST